MRTIDINCDVGEGIDNEALLMPYISSCNIACGGHAGDVDTMDRVIALAKANNVKIGAHPSFPDREHFGRKAVDISNIDLEESLVQQIQSLQERLKISGADLHHVKAHGALYNLAIKDASIAAVIINAVKKTALETILYVPVSSMIEKLALDEGLQIHYEVFADRNYNEDLSLVSRNFENAVLSDKAAVVPHLLSMLIEGNVQTITGQLIPIKADTCCVHGDNEAAIEIVKYIHKSLLEKGIKIG